ncbi:MAG: hypothetical protein ACKESC_01970 [Candidatus Hodgkinia cicadicola]
MSILDISKKTSICLVAKHVLRSLSRSCIFISLASGFELHSFICEL